MTRISQQQLESYLWGAATLLRGTIDAGDYKQFIFPLLFYKRLCDVYDEETRTALAESDGDKEFASYPENHRFQIPPESHWNETRKVAKNVGTALQNALRVIETANPDKLYGIFGDAQWTNKDRLPDSLLRDLIEHFSSLELTIANLPEDELGNGYEYLIKKFADDAGHTAAEFYTNRTVVHLMTELLQPQPGESVYDPTCGSGGMPLSCVAHLRRQGKEWRNVRIYGQERNLMTSSIARMNCFLHGIEDFRIERGDTLAEPKFVQGDRLQQFDVVLANPPYSIKQWDREAFASDPWGRNIFGTPPRGRADYAFWQHIIQSMNPQTGRCAILFPHGVLFRQEEAEMRRKLIEADLIECVIGLGPNLFYNSPMEACVVICRMAKPEKRRNKLLFINAVGEVTRERAQSFLTENHIGRIINAYQQFEDEPGFTCVASLEEIREHGFSINIPLYITDTEHRRTGMRESKGSIEEVVAAWLTAANNLRTSLSRLFGNDTVGPLFNSDNVLMNPPAWLDISKWQSFRFDQIAENIRESVMPRPKDSINYIGLEHMDSGSLHIRRCGSEADLIGQKLKMRKGDILFARRNAYLRRIAIAPHDGLFSAHGMILRAKPEVVLPEFLPFFMMSDCFMNRAVGISVGSLSPTVNWSTLKQEEFILPPLDQQRHIGELLWPLDDYAEKARITLEKIDGVLKTELDHFLYRQEEWPSARCTPILSEPPRNGLSPPASECGGGFPTLSISAIRNGLVVTEGNLKFAKVEEQEIEQFMLRSKDILVVRGNGNLNQCGAAGIVTSFPENCFYPDLLIRLRFKPDVLISDFAVMQWNEPKTHARLLRKAKSTNGIWKINGQDIKTHELLTPPLTAQKQFLEEISYVVEAREKQIALLNHIGSLQIAIINRLVS